MPEGRVLATPEARSAVQRLKTLVSGDLLTMIRDLEKQGDTLADSNQWDGSLANQFRGTWPGNKTTINNMRTDLEKLQQDVDRITQNIMAAGGN
ncbi:MAG: WXG100 family type VII secretion target [Pseudonocardiaceae bacterium]